MQIVSNFGYVVALNKTKMILFYVQILLYNFICYVVCNKVRDSIFVFLNHSCFVFLLKFNP